MNLKNIRLNEKLLKKNKEGLVIVFGSQVSGRMRPGSDIDVGIVFEDERIKSEMSVSAIIITNMKQNVLVVPNSAIKSLPSRQAGQTGTSYVESFDFPLAPPTDGFIGSTSTIAPNKIPVEIGLTNDSKSEIISGIKEGDEIVIRTILPTTKTTAAAPSLFGNTGGNKGK